jgi:uncharacterized membrane protein YpjA
VKNRKIRQADFHRFPYTVLEPMIHWKRAALFGWLSWVIPFVLSIALFPLKRLNAPLYIGLMNLIGLLTAAVLLNAYFRSRAVSGREAVRIALLWLAMNLVLDYPFFFGPMQMTAATYCSEIGISYLSLPAFAWGATRLARP